MKFCSKCGSEMESNQRKCGECGHVSSSMIVKTIWNVIRYILGLLFCTFGVIGLLADSWIGIFIILVGVSLFPFIYGNRFNSLFGNPKTANLIQVFLPIIFFVILMNVVSSFDSDSDYDYNNSGSHYNKNNTSKESVTKVIKDNLGTNQIIKESSLNSETKNYDFKIKINGENLSEYVCASDLQSLAKKVAATEKLGDIEFECSKNGETIYYVVVENVGSISPSIVSENTKFYDANHNAVDTNIGTLYEKHIEEFKKICGKYNYKDVLRSPDTYMGKPAYWFGEIVQVVDKSDTSSTFRINVSCEKYQYIGGYSCNDTIYVSYAGPQSFIEDDMVKMWGYMFGTQSYTTVLGASVTVPYFHAMYMELQN